ncbi:ARM repeat-containing protein [Tilletiaria anomala UBC 951]|uniref:ARM repeat-containing protein n=1 Tax=Tilletiaria anomala (strain ATCC 24038 / CBS 436.72 / UBC 951) TaxID=1037660 RepID=A0A066WJH4_TILAU|nr:ARM repeat-containing protein [Tilletiaria anomala UBC 951]KDN52708.1 ARM repeat-containing protein [Tilletiaria anomala UBC 951]
MQQNTSHHRSQAADDDGRQIGPMRTPLAQQQDLAPDSAMSQTQELPPPGTQAFKLSGLASIPPLSLPHPSSLQQHIRSKTEQPSASPPQHHLVHDPFGFNRNRHVAAGAGGISSSDGGIQPAPDVFSQRPPHSDPAYDIRMGIGGPLDDTGISSPCDTVPPHARSQTAATDEAALSYGISDGRTAYSQRLHEPQVGASSLQSGFTVSIFPRTASVEPRELNRNTQGAHVGEHSVLPVSVSAAVGSALRLHDHSTDASQHGGSGLGTAGLGTGWTSFDTSGAKQAEASTSGTLVSSIDLDEQMRKDESRIFHSTPPGPTRAEMLRYNPPIASTPLSGKVMRMNPHVRQSTNSTVSLGSDSDSVQQAQAEFDLRKENSELRSLVGKIAAQLDYAHAQLHVANEQIQRQHPIQGTSRDSASLSQGGGPRPVPMINPALHAALMQGGQPFLPVSSANAAATAGTPPNAQQLSVVSHTSLLHSSAPSKQSPALLFRPTFNTPAQEISSATTPPRIAAPAATSRSGADRWAALKEDGPIRRRDTETSAETLIAQVLSGRNGQDTSIFLQQQLKNCTDERKKAIVKAMKPVLIALCEDKHGNFLVQRAIGVDASLAWDLKERFVDLALSQFGCHVVQRVLDEEEPIKMAVVEALLSDRLMDTLAARSSVHIWQKALEITWTQASFRAKIFQVLNDSLRAKWALTAMQETGSIICQNIFESADASEKGECIREILERIPDCANNQWGVWVVQHMIDHGEPETRQTVFQRLLEQAVQLTLSQYGQKAIMTALKTNDPAFMVPYVDILCNRDGGGQASGTSSRRSVLIDIACVPQGFNIVTQLLTNVDMEQRERIVSTVRRNSVFLKGSKAGLRVHTLCERARAYSGY